MREQRTRSAVLMAAVVSLAVVLAACTPEQTAPLALTSADDGSTQAVKLAQRITVTLPSNPTTGYRWAIDGQAPPVVKQVGEPEYSAESTLVGAGGQEVWTFEADQTGPGTLKMKYWRSFEPSAPPADTFEVTFDVR